MNTFLKISASLSISALLIFPFLAVAKSVDKITICHATGSEKNPYVEITINVNGLNGHSNHEGDIIPAPAEGCIISPIPDNPIPL